MARVTTFIYAQEHLNEMNPNGPRIHLINPLNVLTPPLIPCQFSFVIGVGIIDLDTSVEHCIKYKFIGPKPDSLVIVDSGDNIIIPPQRNINNLPQELLGVFFDMNLRNTILGINGEYRSEVYLDGILLGEFPINVWGLKNVSED
ncbi:hypothetical protein [Desulfosporosinus sp.]|uniref:hypothetical protein n=1 Tax=Desulfosporosinus sp. TaxID=157907 RepID=UPI00231521AF|nr:hypothetical protein [Desulfosporosinus sp.]MCO5387660.1 hypothetical protein [Desulfosporosinus sp.]MDA8223146.1 hypothetical protein [Desulfitobacterium hafniense]